MVSLNQLHKSQPTVRETVIEALQFIQIQDFTDFDLKFDYFNNPTRGRHDARHLYRTMLATALIARKLNEPRNGLLAFCGAYIHDLAQHHDGEGPSHGPLAAKTKWDMFNKIWDKYALTELERSNVRAAVSRHSDGGNSDFTDNYLVNQILHDADALDRCRFHQHGRLDWSYLSHPALKCIDGHPSKTLQELISLTESICAFTKFLPSFLTFRDFLENIP